MNFYLRILYLVMQACTCFNAHAVNVANVSVILAPFLLFNYFFYNFIMLEWPLFGVGATRLVFLWYVQ